jgi:hypothetical protein
MVEQLRGPVEKFLDSPYSKRDRHRTCTKFRLNLLPRIGTLWSYGDGLFFE